ncbi:MAG: response regulator [Deltaproteobacteria bacterium]|nr:response regulator [Deltaproteobacteria bacterium]
MEKILVVDDEHFVREFVKDALTEALYDVIEAENGNEGVIKAVREVPDLIILDIVMPEMDGIEVCKQIRETVACRNTPIIMHTSMDESRLIEKAMKAGASDYMLKPIKAEMLLIRVKNNLRLVTEIKNNSALREELETANNVIDALNEKISSSQIIDLSDEV